MNPKDLSPEELLIDALLETHARDSSEDDSLVEAILSRTTRTEGYDDPAIHSLLEVYQERAGGADRELVTQIQEATTRRSTAEAPVIPFPKRGSGFLKVAAIVIAFCGGVYGLVTMIPVSQPSLSNRPSAEPITEPRMHVTIIRSDSPTTATPAVSEKIAKRSDQWSTPLIASAATDFVSSIDFTLSDPAVQFGMPASTGLSTEPLTDRPDRRNPETLFAEGPTAELYASAPSERAVAIVNRSVISERDLAIFQSARSTPIAPDAAIEALIDERLVLSEFVRRGGQVTETFVDQAIFDFVEQTYDGNAETFETSITDAGMTIDEFRDLLERQIAVRGLLATDPTLAANLRSSAEILRAK